MDTKHFKKVKQIDIKKGMLVNQLVKEMELSGVMGAGRIAKAANIFEAMIKDKDCKVFLGLAGAMVPGGMKTYRGFLLDADNTLFDYDRGETEALDETLAQAVPHVPREKARASYRSINAGYWRRFEQGAVSLAALKVGRFADMLKDLGQEGDAAVLSDVYLTRLSQKAYFLPDAG